MSVFYPVVRFDISISIFLSSYQIHGTDFVTPIEETLRALDTLVTQGKVRYIGCSNWAAWKLAKALGISEFKNLARFDTLQAYYSIAGRELERELVPLMEHEKTGLLVWSPLAGGLLSGKYTRDNQKPAGARRAEFDFPLVDKERTWKILDVMRPIAEAHNCSPARISLAWLLAKPVVSSVIIGARNIDQLNDNLASVDITLTAEEIKTLDEVSNLPLEYPGWMIPFQALDRLEALPDRWAAIKDMVKQQRLVVLSGLVARWYRKWCHLVISFSRAERRPARSMRNVKSNIVDIGANRVIPSIRC